MSEVTIQTLLDKLSRVYPRENVTLGRSRGQGISYNLYVDGKLEIFDYAWDNFVCRIMSMADDSNGSISKEYKKLFMIEENGALYFKPNATRENIVNFFFDKIKEAK